MTYGRQETEKAIGDFSEVIQMPDAPAEHKAKAFSNRCWRFPRRPLWQGCRRRTRSDHSRSRLLDGHGNLAISLLFHGQKDDALRSYDLALSFADSTHLDVLTRELREAIAKHGSIAGADEAMACIEAQRQALAQRSTIDAQSAERLSQRTDCRMCRNRASRFTGLPHHAPPGPPRSESAEPAMGRSR